ncbi:MAG TPA: ATP-binding protein [Methanocorpusculum sp.]|nr:ATP-binding protein [Methanocorpusculum sp.]
MQRLLYSELLKWKNSANPQPLILQGVRQCGKTWLLKEFGEKEFEDTAYFNFERTAQLLTCFEGDFNPKRIIDALGLNRNKAIIPGKTLLILDEIQICPRAITSLKYFAEEMPKLHIAAAGSLLGVSLAQMGKQISFPVGKVRTLTLYPLNFEEYLLANGEDMLHDNLAASDENDTTAVLFEQKLTELYYQYLITGGMPAAVNAWISSHNIEDVDIILTSILSDYEKDFVKYAPKTDYPKLTAVWESIPEQLAKENQKFIFSRVKTGARARDLEDALYWLISAGLIYKISKTEQPYIPLSAAADTANFKIYLSDTGLLRVLSGFEPGVILNMNEQTAYMRGLLTENFILTELISAGHKQIYFWKAKSEAEVDFLLQNKSSVIPVEVKAGKHIRSRSLTEYRKKYSPERAVRCSLQPLSVHNDEYGTLLSIPNYLVWNLQQYLRK